MSRQAKPTSNEAEAALEGAGVDRLADIVKAQADPTAIAPKRNRSIKAPSCLILVAFVARLPGKRQRKGNFEKPWALVFRGENSVPRNQTKLCLLQKSAPLGTQRR
jgi:hypothetical protein